MQIRAIDLRQIARTRRYHHYGCFVAGPGDGLGLGEGLGAGEPSGDGDGSGDPLGLGLGDGIGVGLGLCSGGVAGLSVGVAGTGVALASGSVAGVVLPVLARLLFRPADVAGAAISAGAGPACAGLATSAPTAAGIDRFERRLAIARPGENEQGWAGSTDDRVNLLPLRRPRSETICGVVELPSPI